MLAVYMAQKGQINIKKNQSMAAKKGSLRSIFEAIISDNTSNRSGLSSQGEILAQEHMRIFSEESGTKDKDRKYERGEVARNEQIRIIQQFAAFNGEPQEPRTRGEVASQEQMKIFGQVMAAASGKQFAPRTRGEVAAAEQMNIIRQVFSAD